MRSRIGLLTEAPGLYERMSAAANLDFHARLHGLPTPKRRERVRACLDLLGLWERRNDQVAGFSKGMKQKLAIARAVLHEPVAVFLDEPTSGLDPESARDVRAFIRDLRDAGRAIFLCTHNLDEARRLCDRVAVFRGRILRLGSPRELEREVVRHRLAVRMADEPEPFVEVVRALPAVREAEVADGELVVVLDELDRDAPPVVRALVEAGAEIQRVAGLDSALEAAYLAILNEEADASAAPVRRRDRVISRVFTVIVKELADVCRSRLILTTLIVPTILYIVVSLVALSAGNLPGVAGMSRGELEALERTLPRNSGVPTVEAFQLLVVDQILVLYMLAPLFIPLTIASYSIIGEKQLRTLEPLLATPIRTWELMAAKSVAAIVPGVLVGWASYAAFLILAAFIATPGRAAARARADLAGLVRGALAAVCAAGGVDGGDRLVAHERPASGAAAWGGGDPADLGALVGAGVRVRAAGRVARADAGSGVGLADVALLWAAVRLFDRETILTRWR